MRARSAVLLVITLAATGCGSSTPADLSGFGEPCGEHRDCQRGYLCFEGSCAPEDIEPPPEGIDGPLDDGGDPADDVDGPVGDEDVPPSNPADPSTTTAFAWMWDDCDDLKALYPAAAVCEGSFLVGNSTSAITAEMQPATPSELSACEIIEGDLAIEDSDLVDLSALAGLRGVCGNLEIRDNTALTSLLGLGSLTRVMDYVVIEENPLLTSLVGLDSLRQTTMLLLRSNALHDVVGLSSLQQVWTLDISFETNLSSLDGLSSIRELAGLTLAHCAQLDDVDALGDLEVVLLSFTLYDLDSLEGLPAFAGTRFEGSFSIVDTPVATLDGLADADLGSLRYFRLEDVQGPTSLSGMEGIGPELRDLLLVGNPHLANIDALENIEAVTEWLRVEYNPALTSLEGLHNLAHGKIIRVVYNSHLDTCQAQALFADTEIEEELTVHSNAGPDECE